MRLKSAGTSRASSPGSHTRDVFVHSAFNGTNARHYPNWTFGAAGENMAERKVGGEGRMANVWRHETEAGMRRREVEAELRKQDQVELQRRRSEGAKRRKIGETEEERMLVLEKGEEKERMVSEDGRTVSEDRRMSVGEDRRMSVSEDRRMSVGEDRRMSIAESERRMSIVEPEKRFPEPEKREPEKRMSIETERKPSLSESDRRMSIVEHVKRATEAQNATKDGRTSNSLPISRTTDVFSRARRGSAPMPGAWTDEKQSVIVISDSPELDTGDAEMDLPDPSEKLFPERAEGSSQSTPLGPFGHIWPQPTIDSGKKGRRQRDLEAAPTRSFITPLNLPPVPATTQVKQSTPVVDDEAKDKEAGSSQPSVLRSMLTTMPPRAAFVAAIQTFVSQPSTKTRRNRAVIMTKSLMKDALGVLLDPTDPLPEDHAPEKKEGEKEPRRKMSLAIDTTDHTSPEFRAWARRMFTTVKTSRGEDVLAFDGKPVVVEDDIYETIVICHSQGNHCSTEETAKLVDQEHSWVPRALIEAFVQKCPGCPPENKITNATTKPKKRKSVRAGPRRKPTRRGKKQDESLRRRKSGKEASPDESDADEGDQEEDELKESGDEAGPADVKTSDPEPEPAGEDQDQDQDQDEAEPDPEPEPEPDADEPDEAEEPEMESEDEHVSRPSKNGI